MQTPPDLYCVVGNPVAHSQSPWIHARFAELTGQHLHYTRQLLPQDGFAAGIAGLMAQGLRGCNVTVPFKFEAAALAHELSARAALAQASNTLRFEGGRIWGDNTDGVGLVRDIEHNAACPLKGLRLLLLGAGGAAAGVLGPLLQAGVRELVLCNRTAEKAQHLLQRHANLAALQKTELLTQSARALQGDFDVIINATSASLQGLELELPSHVVHAQTLACDLMYGAPAEPFLRWARALGARSHDGLGMLVEQAAEAFALWRGVRPPSSEVLAELRARLA